MTQDDVATVLEEIATFLALKGENDFRCRAYSSAARAISQYAGNFKQLVESGNLGTIRGVGDTLQDKVHELVTTGRMAFHAELKASIPPGLLDMLRIPGVGPKKVKALSESLGIDTLEKLQAACVDGSVSKLKGFGEKTQAKILEGISFLGSVGNRVQFHLAFPLGQRLLAQLLNIPGVIRGELCGSLRRRRETAKDIDIVIAADNPAPVMQAFVSLPEVIQVVGHGETKSSIVAEMKLGPTTVVLNADLRVVTNTQFPFTVAYLTGSKAHNVRMRQRAQELGYSLNEYGLGGPECESEEAIYATLGMQYVPPEMREDTGEVEAALSHRLPSLVHAGEIRGVFHNHTTASDGRNSLEEMALAAKALGLEYFGVGDHSQVLTVANGLTPDRVRAQWAEADALNAKLKGIRILKGTECDILPDGRMDFDDALLAGFDYVVASVHSHFNLSEEDQTQRICKALANPHVTMLGHPTGRLLLRRDAYKVDLDAVLVACRQHGKMMEINAQPDRLDLDWPYVKKAKAMGIPLVINPDAHAAEELAYYPYGVNVARRGWLEAKDVFNTRPLKEMMKTLQDIKPK